MNVLVTGGAGFIGSHVTEQLLAAGHRVAVLDNLSTGKRSHIPSQAEFHMLDIADPAVEDVLANFQPEVVIHHAAQIEVGVSVTRPDWDAEQNIVKSIRLLECCRRRNVRKIIYASSAAVYGRPQHLPINETHPVVPLSGYGISKHTVEHYLLIYQHLYGMQFTILRYANAYGIRQDPKGEGGVISVFTERLLSGMPCTIQGDGSQTRDFVYVSDLAAANVLALDACDGETFNIGTGRAISIRTLCEMMMALQPDALPISYAPPRPGDIHDSCFDSSRARDVLGWQPQVTLEDGIARTMSYYRARL